MFEKCSVVFFVSNNTFLITMHKYPLSYDHAHELDGDKKMR